MPDVGRGKRARVLDPVDRVSEVIFGLLMALTFTGSLSVASAGREEVRTMMFAALGCNLAWGLADAVMYLVRTATERTRVANLVAKLRGTTNPESARSLTAEALPGRLAEIAGPEVLDLLHKRVLDAPAAPASASLRRDDFVGAFGVFLLVVLATIPVVIPFALIEETLPALRVSNAIALVMLFVAGWALGRHAGGTRWKSALAMVAVGTALVLAIMALGG